MGGAAGLTVVLLTPAASAEPALYPCGYMNHDSKAYAACLSDQAAADAAKSPAPTVATAPKRIDPKPAAKPKDRVKPASFLD
jgi:hypothetical protein